MNSSSNRRIMIVTGMSGAGKSTALRTLEDLGWEIVDNLPLRLLDPLLEAPRIEIDGHARPLAVGIDSRTRDFDPLWIAERFAGLQAQYGADADLLFLDCAGAELGRRYSETRRRHPLAADRPIADGIAAERALLEGLRRVATHLVDTTDTKSNALQQELRSRFGTPADAPVLNVMSFGFARGLPRNADLVFDMRFLRNPHWVPELKPLTGLDAAVADHIAQDPAYAEALARIEELLLVLLPRYASEGKAYVTVAFGCTGGQHRSVHVCETIGRRLRDAGFAPAISHRDIGHASAEPVAGRLGATTLNRGSEG